MVKTPERDPKTKIERSINTNQTVTPEKPTSRKVGQRGKHPMPALLRIPCAMLFLMIISIFLTWFMLWRTNLCDADAAMEFIREKPDLAVYNYLVITSLLGVLAAVTWRPFFSTGVMFCFLSVFSFIHIQKYQLRAEPFLPEELKLAENTGNLVQFVEMGELISLIAGIVFVLVGAILAEFYVRKFVGRDPKRLPWWNRTALIPRLTYTMIALAIVAGIVRPVMQRRDLDWIEGVDFIAWNQTDNYAENGFILGFIYNMGNQVLEQPEDYSGAKMAAIAEKYQTKKVADTARVSWSEEVENVVVILAETFYDPALLTEYYPHRGGDVTPNLHKIFREYPSGYMYSPEYGGGTANVEFEIQTGLTNYWAMTFPYVNILSKTPDFSGIASWGKDNGLATTAIHSYDGSMYKRNLVYPNIGYDEFIDEKKMNYTDKEGEAGVINDESVYLEIIKLIEDNDEPQVIGAVTMQNHGPYDQAHYTKLDFKLLEEVKYPWELENSYQSLHYADKYLGEFIEQLDELEERTVVLWFGDHAMGVMDEYVKSEEKLDRDVAHFTPYFVYANFEIESPYTEREVAKINKQSGIDFTEITGANRIRGIDLPTTSPNCLQNTMYNILNIEKPTRFYILDEVCTKTPILTNAFLAGETIEPYAALKDYELLNYDQLFGKRYWGGD